MIDPQTEQELRDLINKVLDIRMGQDMVFVESLKRNVLQDIIEAGVIDNTVSGINHTTTVAAGGGNVSAAKTFDRRMRVTIDEVDYYLGLYNT